MVTQLEDNREAIASLCRKYGVVRLDAFGSALRDDYVPGVSDLDLLADFGSQDPFQLIDSYFGLLGELRALLGLPVDLVMVDALKNRYVRAEVERTRRVLFAA
jgi:uncharacterized protein